MLCAGRINAAKLAARAYLHNSFPRARVCQSQVAGGQTRKRTDYRGVQPISAIARQSCCEVLMHRPKFSTYPAGHFMNLSNQDSL
jgi:hypothetical protein